MARKRKSSSKQVLLAGLDDCILGMHYPRAGEAGPPVVVYSADMIAARLRDDQGMTQVEARCFVTDEIEARWMGPGTPRLVWAATIQDFGINSTKD